MIDLSGRHSPRRWHAAAILLPLALLAGGCTTGSSASFTMAPLFFSESADPAGEILPDSAPVVDHAAAAPGAPAGLVQVSYIAASGNAVLPVNVIADGSALPLVAINTAGLVSSGVLEALPGAVGGIAVALGPVGLTPTLAGTTATIDTALTAPAATAANTVAATTVALNNVVGAATSVATTATNATAATVTTVAAAIPPVAVPVVSAVAAALPVATAAVAAPVASVTAAISAPRFRDRRRPPQRDRRRRCPRHAGGGGSAQGDDDRNHAGGHGGSGCHAFGSHGRPRAGHRAAGDPRCHHGGSHRADGPARQFGDEPCPDVPDEPLQVSHAHRARDRAGRRLAAGLAVLAATALLLPWSGAQAQTSVKGVPADRADQRPAPAPAPGAPPAAAPAARDKQRAIAPFQLASRADRGIEPAARRHRCRCRAVHREGKSIRPG